LAEIGAGGGVGAAIFLAAEGAGLRLLGEAANGVLRDPSGPFVELLVGTDVNVRTDRLVGV